MQYKSNDVVELILLTAIEYAQYALHVKVLFSFAEQRCLEVYYAGTLGHGFGNLSSSGNS